MRCYRCGGYRMNPEPERFDIEVATGDPEWPSACASVSLFPRLRGKVIDGDELITPRNEITIIFDYPLSRDARFTFQNPEGFTRLDFYHCIYDGYRLIYAEEESDDRDPGHIPGMLNRAQSQGRYGIWGHDVGDLVIEGVQLITQEIVDQHLARRPDPEQIQKMLGWTHKGPKQEDVGQGVYKLIIGS